MAVADDRESQDPKPESETSRGAATETDDDDEGTAQNKQENKGEDKASGVQ